MGKKQSTAAYVLHLVIGLFFMFLFGKVCPTWSTLNEFGVASIGILAGMLWLVTHGFGLLAPSMLGFYAVIFTGYMSANEVLAATLGNPNTYLVIMCLVLTFAFTDCGAGDVLARWMISRKMLNGRPYLFTAVFFIAMCLLGALVGAMSLCLLAFAFIDSVAETVGYEKNSQWRKMMLTIIMVIGGAAGAILPFKAGPMMVISMMEPTMTAAGIEFSNGLYMLSALLGSLIFIAFALIAMKPLFHVDMDKLKNLDVEKIGAGSTTKMNRKQLLTTIFMCIGFAYSIVLIWLPKDFFLYKQIAGISLPVWLSLMVVVISFIRLDGEPLFQSDRLFGKAVLWGPVFAAASFTVIGTMMASPDNGVRGWLTEIMSGILGDMPFPAFILLVIAIAVVCTNFFSNSATAVILGSIVAPFAIGYAAGGVNPTVFCAAIANSTGVAFLTMGAGGVAPVFLGLDCMKEDSAWIWKHGVLLAALYIAAAAIAYILCGILL